MYRVRFHLAQGPHFMHWQVLSKECGREYYNPADTQIEMFNCHLRNRLSTARKIYDGGNKTVCAWIDCEHIKISVPRHMPNFPIRPMRVCYNPKIAPNWRDGDDRNIDGLYLPYLATQNTQILSPLCVST